MHTCAMERVLYIIILCLSNCYFQVLSSAGNILEDESANRILSSSKVLSIEIQAKQAAAAITEIEIDDARLQYVPVSKHGAVLFFCISDLGAIDPMYQYSLVWLVQMVLFLKSNCRLYG